jgi:predicted AlkP superfamily pyrophosphatase or phosphodiesterase
MMSKRFLRRSCVGVGAAGALLGAGCVANESVDDATELSRAEGPALVVLVVVDQLRSDLLDRYDHLFTGGLRRLLDHGVVYRNATHDHAETSTAPGHTTLATGVFPTRHGVVGNSWSEFRDGEWVSVYSMEDLDAPILGHPDMPGRSPANMYRGGLPDWILARDAEARVVSVSRKDRGAIGLAGRARAEVYWLSPTTGRFITSSWYTDAYPAWIARFNDEVMPEVYAQMSWESTVPPEAIRLTRPDTSAYERDGRNTYFPHRAADVVDASDPSAVNQWRYDDTPFPDDATLALARTAVDELALGLRGHVDYLGVALSQTDLVGHRFGPLSREQLDNLLRLDRGLGEFFSFLDEEVGAGRWIIGFSADHGVGDLPEHAAEVGVDARRLTRADAVRLREEAEAAAQGRTGIDREAAVREAVAAIPVVGAAYTFSEIESVDPAVEPDSFALLYSRSHSRERILSYPGRFGVHFRYAPNTLEVDADPASHGSPYYYDRHVPLIFMGGSGVSSGISHERASTVDMAPTLAWLAGIDAPNDLDGRVLRGDSP